MAVESNLHRTEESVDKRREEKRREEKRREEKKSKVKRVIISNAHEKVATS